jgi:hypothetical protein
MNYKDLEWKFSNFLVLSSFREIFSSFMKYGQWLLDHHHKKFRSTAKFLEQSIRKISTEVQRED